MGFSSQYMLKRWRTEKTALLRTREVQLDRLEEYRGVHFFISCNIGHHQQPYKQFSCWVCSVICQMVFDNGRNDFLSLEIGFRNVYHLMHVSPEPLLPPVLLLKTCWRCYHPSGIFIIHHHPPDPHHIQCLENYFWGFDSHSYMAKRPCTRHFAGKGDFWRPT